PHLACRGLCFISPLRQPPCSTLFPYTTLFRSSEHPLHSIRDQLRRKTDCSLAEVERRRDGEVVTVGGIVSAVKCLTTKKGEPMVFIRLDDGTCGLERAVFNSVYAQARELCAVDTIL